MSTFAQITSAELSSSGWLVGFSECLMARKTPPPLFPFLSLRNIEYCSVSKISLLKWLSFNHDSVPTIMSGLVHSDL